MEQDHKDKAPALAGDKVPVERAKEKDKVTAKARAGDKAPAEGRDKEKAKGKEEPMVAGKDAERINNIHKKGELLCQVEIEQDPWEWDR